MADITLAKSTKSRGHFWNVREIDFVTDKHSMGRLWPGHAVPADSAQHRDTRYVAVGDAAFIGSVRLDIA